METMTFIQNHHLEDDFLGGISHLHLLFKGFQGYYTM